MKKLALVLAVAAFVGCEEKKAAPDDAAKSSGSKVDEGTGSLPKSIKEQPAKPPTDKPKVARKVTDPSKKGQISIYRCGCTGKEWTQPAEEEKLCIDFCEGKMPECGELVRTEPEKK